MRRDHGLTLIELAVAFAIAAILAVMAAPSWSKLVQRHRLEEAARMLAADLGEARLEAIRRNQPVELVFAGAGEHWCYMLVAGSASAAPECDVREGGPDARLLKRVDSADRPGVNLVEAQSMRVGADGVAASVGVASVTLGNARGERLRVRLSLLARTSICSLAGPIPGMASC